MDKLVHIKMNGNILFHFIGFGFEINMKKYIDNLNRKNT
jgi:hypothetical protein